MTNVKSLLEMYVKMGGSLTDTYSDIAGGVPVGQYSTISDAILACSKKYSSGGGGGGAEKFVVTLTEANDTWTADKTVAEIVAADAAGKIVVCKVMFESGDVPPSEIPLSVAIDNAVMFGGVSMTEKATVITVVGVLDDGATEWNVESVELGSSNAPLIVTLTADGSTGNLVGDKTYQECYTAFHGGRRVTFNATIESVDTSASVLAAGLQGGNYSLAAYFGDGILSASGAATDYVTFNLQG